MTFTRLLQERPWTAAWVVIELCLLWNAIVEIGWR